MKARQAGTPFTLFSPAPPVRLLAEHDLLVVKKEKFTAKTLPK